MKNVMHLNIDCSFDPNPGGNPLMVFEVSYKGTKGLWKWDITASDWLSFPVGAGEVIANVLAADYKLS